MPRDFPDGLQASGGGLIIGTAALATTATGGHLWLPTCAGTPTGTPTAHTGTAAVIYDTAGHVLYAHDGSWRPVSGGAAGFATAVKYGIR